MGYTIKENVKDKSGKIIGVILCADNGDEQYLTIDSVSMYGMPGQISEDLMPLSNPTSLREALDILMEQEEV